MIKAFKALIERSPYVIQFFNVYRETVICP